MTPMTTTLDDLLARRDRLRRLPEPRIRRVLRERAGLSQGDLADVLGVDRAAISRYESGNRSPRPAIAERYLDVLDRLAAER